MHYQQERNYGCRISDAWTYRGLKTAILENELLKVVVLLDKGADIYQFVHKPSDVDFLWRSPWGVRDPRAYRPTGGSPVSQWLDFYEGGWQTVLPGGGFPSTYGGVELGLHAEANLLPWDSAIVEDTPDKVSLRCWVRCARTPIVAEKTLTLTRNSPVLTIHESVTNEGTERYPVVWGQHIALGAPFLGGDCVIDLPGGKLINHPQDSHPNNRLKAGFEGPWPFTQGKKGERLDLSKVPPPGVKAYDQSYIAEMPEGWYAVTNQKLKVGFAFAWTKEVFKYLWYWQSLGGGTGYPWYG
ncbi:MAG: DUF4432 family protein, partial [Chloroflexota bacterium]